MKRCRHRLARVLAGLLAFCACADAEGTRRPSIVLVVLDTVRADAVSAYGRFEGTTPEVDRLAAEGVLYERAYAQAPWTLPSHVTLFSGLPPTQHGISSRYLLAPDEVVMLGERLRDAGYETAGFSENPWVHSITGLTQGFDRFGEIVLGGADAGGSTLALDWLNGWLESRSRDRPFFLFLNFVDAHWPYLVREENAFLPPGVSTSEAEALMDGLELGVCSDWGIESREMAILRGLYLGGLAAADAKLARVLRLLDQHDPGRRRLSIVTSDHGEHFGEHGLRDHYFSLHEVLLHVPLVVHGLGGPARIAEPVALMDVVPSILAWLGLAIQDELPGRPLPLDRSVSPEPRTVTASFVDPLAGHVLHPEELGAVVVDYATQLRASCPPHRPAPGDRESAIRHPYKLLRVANTPDRLFDLSRDPGEDRDLASEERELVAAMGSQLGRGGRLPEATDAPEVSETALEALRALGYVQGGD